MIKREIVLEVNGVLYIVKDYEAKCLGDKWYLILYYEGLNQPLKLFAKEFEQKTVLYLVEKVNHADD